MSIYFLIFPKKYLKFICNLCIIILSVRYSINKYISGHIAAVKDLIHLCSIIERIAKMKYNIAGIIVDMNVRFPRLTLQSEDYKCDEDIDANIKIRLTPEFYEQKLIENPHLDYEMIEYIWMGSEFYNALIHFNGMLLHSSCVVYNNEAYLFSAPCGTGKSTHTQLWLKRFDGAYILNDDKPAIRITENGVYAYGTPFSGKTNLNVNNGVPIKGICVLERDTFNHIEPISPDDALFSILNQTVRPINEDDMDKMLSTLDKVLKSVPVYRLYCNMELDAPETAYNGMNKMADDK